MNKQALVELVHGIVGGTKVQAEEVIESLIEGITKTLKKGDEVSIAGLLFLQDSLQPWPILR